MSLPKHADTRCLFQDTPVFQLVRALNQPSGPIWGRAFPVDPDPFPLNQLATGGLLLASHHPCHSSTALGGVQRAYQNRKARFFQGHREGPNCAFLRLPLSGKTPDFLDHSLFPSTLWPAAGSGPPVGVGLKGHQKETMQSWESPV